MKKLLGCLVTLGMVFGAIGLAMAGSHRYLPSTINVAEGNILTIQRMALFPMRCKKKTI